MEKFVIDATTVEFAGKHYPHAPPIPELIAPDIQLHGNTRVCLAEEKYPKHTGVLTSSLGGEIQHLFALGHNSRYVAKAVNVSIRQIQHYSSNNAIARNCHQCGTRLKKSHFTFTDFDFCSKDCFRTYKAATMRQQRLANVKDGEAITQALACKIVACQPARELVKAKVTDPTMQAACLEQVKKTEKFMHLHNIHRTPHVVAAFATWTLHYDTQDGAAKLYGTTAESIRYLQRALHGFQLK